MKRSMKLSVLVGLALASSQALALDLGQIQVKSALGQPLVADIPLHADHSGHAGHVTVTMASADAFARAGINRSDLKVPLRFKVITHADGNRFIRVTSAQPVREPYLDFLIKVSWPEGKVLREYTVLLDPLSRATAMASHAAITTSSSARAATPPQRQAQPIPSPAAAPAPMAPRETRASDTYGPVQRGDTLSSIALANPIDGVSYQQMLMALKAANPNAFYENNVNALKSGAVLRIPTREQAQTVTPAAAIAAVRQQNRSWQQIAGEPTLVAASGGDSAPMVAAGDPDSSDHLTLVPPEAEASSSAGASAAGDASAGELRQQLARSQEALSSQTQSTADLNSRVAKLEKLQKQNQRLLSLKNAEIAALKSKLADARKAAGLPAQSRSSANADLANAASVAGPSLAASASAGAIMPGAATSTGDQALANAAPADGASVAAVAPAAAGPAAGPQSPENDPAAQPQTLADDPQAAQTAPATAPSSAPAAPWYQQLWARIALAIVIVLLIIWAILRRRKPAPAPTRSPLADRFDDTPYAAREAATTPDDEQAAPATGDPDGEHELLVRLGQHPDEVGLHLELVSLYYARRDVDRFEAAAEAMHAYVDDQTQPEWQDVLAMGHELAPDYPLFVPSDAAPDRDVAQDESGLPEDVSALPPEAVSEAEPEPDDEAVDENHAGFVFTGEPAFEEHRGPAAAGTEQTFDVETGGLPDESEFDALPPLSEEREEAGDVQESERFAAADEAPPMDPDELSVEDDAADDEDARESEPETFSDDPVDTKLDLARAYIDMGDPDGARAMLDEAVNEGSQMQKDTAQKLLDELA
jgi:pilus assembly protein FimV